MKARWVLSILALLVSISAHAQSQLNESQRAVFDDAKAKGLPIAVQDFEVEGIQRTLVILGETHVKHKSLSEIEMGVVARFPLRILEGYQGNGGAPWLKERALITLISYLYPFMQKAPEQEVSSLNKTMRIGFSAAPNGRVFYNACHVGLNAPDGVYFDQEGVKSVLKGISDSDTGTFFRMLKQFTKGVATVKNQMGAEMLGFDEGYLGCESPKEKSALVAAFNIPMETGDLRKWKRSKTCGDMICTYGKNGKLSSRELRMIENIYETLRAFPEFNVGLVVVGSAHLPALETFTHQWPQIKASYLK